MIKIEIGKAHARVLKITALFASMVLLMVPNLALANTSPPITISGIWGPNPDVMKGFSDFRFIGRNIFYINTCTGKFLGGDISGTFTQTLHVSMQYGNPAIVEQCRQASIGKLDSEMGLVMQSWPSPNTFEFTHFVREVTCTNFKGTGKSGTFEMLLVSFGHGMPVVKGLGAFDLKGIWVIAHGTGDLAGLHGYGTWWHTTSMTTVPFEYQGQVYFDS